MTEPARSNTSSLFVPASSWPEVSEEPRKDSLRISPPAGAVENGQAGLEVLRPEEMPRRNGVRRIVLGLAPAVLVGLVWETVARGVWVLKGVPFPTPGAALSQLFRLLSGKLLLEHSLYTHLADSLLRWGVGFGLAAGAGLAAGLILGRWPGLDRVARPIVYVLQLVPGLAWIPIALLLFGVGERATVFMIFVTALAPIVINTVAGVRGVDPGYVRAAQMMGTSPRSLFFRVLLPGAVPHILSGLRVGLANGWRVLVAAEMIVGTGTGLGYSILQARWTLDYASSFACILVIVALGLAVEKLGFAPLERRTAERWGVASGN